MASVFPTERDVMSEDEGRSFAMVLATLSAPCMVLRAAVELDILDIIKRAGPEAQLSSTQIAAQLPTNNPSASAPMLDRVLWLMASYSILSSSTQTDSDGRVERFYGLNPVSKSLTKDQGLSSLILLLTDNVYMNAWYRLKEAILDGSCAFNQVHGMGLFEYLGKDTRFFSVFDEGMSNYSTIFAKKMLESYKGFEGISTLVDVGGGNGAILNTITSKYPTIKGINFDLPRVIKDAPTYDGVEHVAGDMFVDVPRGDAIIMKWILHDWSDECCLKLLKNCYAALPEYGKVIVCDYALPVSPETSDAGRLISAVDALMLAGKEGGKERTEQELEALAKGAGFNGFKVAGSAFAVKIMELLKK